MFVFPVILHIAYFISEMLYKIHCDKNLTHLMKDHALFFIISDLDKIHYNT